MPSITPPELLFTISLYLGWLIIILAALAGSLRLLVYIANQSKHLPLILFYGAMRAREDFTWGMMYRLKECTKQSNPEKFREFQEIWEDKEKQN